MRELITRSQINERVVELGREITAHYNGVPFTCLVILKGSFIFAADLVREIETENISIEFVQLSSYKGTKSTGKVDFVNAELERFKEKHILIVEDIVDSGLTLSIFAESLNQIHPKSVKICSLLEKNEVNKGRVKIDFLGFQIPDKFVVGYGLDFDEKFRNMPYIGIFNEG